MLAPEDFIYIAVYMLLSVLIIVYCKLCKIKNCQAVSGVTLFSVMYWLFFFSDAFVR